MTTTTETQGTLPNTDKPKRARKPRVVLDDATVEPRPSMPTPEELLEEARAMQARQVAVAEETARLLALIEQHTRTTTVALVRIDRALGTMLEIEAARLEERNAKKGGQ